MFNSETDILLINKETTPLEVSHQESAQPDSFQFVAASMLGSWESDLTDNSDSDFSHVTDDESEEILDRDWFMYPIALDQADDVCIKVNDLIKRGLIPRHRIMYKYLRDTVHCLVDPNHQYDAEVVEFFNTIEHLGGESTVNFVRGHMFHVTGKGGIKKPEEANTNLGGPSKPTRQKVPTTASGLLKDMHFKFFFFLSSHQMKQLS